VPYNNKKLVSDQIGEPVPQYFNPTSDQYEVVQGSGGATNVILAGNLMQYFGKSTDTKPTYNIIKGSTFFEIDTTNCYMFDGNTWEEI
jgi:hypothetical protein